ncbi:MAG: hypothetical protein ABR535_06055 [Pyrinomonadaceae bacterium]
MVSSGTGTDRLRSYLVMAATAGTIAFNFIAATGRLGGGVDTGAISDKYPTVVTPAGYAFSIWTLIYVGLVAFSIYQLLPQNLVKFRNVRLLYIISCVLNCTWLYFWQGEQIVVCAVILLALAVALFFINYQLQGHESTAEFWATKAPFGIYFGWVTAATLVNFAVTLVYQRVQLSPSAWTTLGASLILVAASLAVLIRLKLANFLYPLAIAWALTAIAVKQSGNTPIVVACAAGVITSLIAALSFVVGLPSTLSREQ